MDPTPIRFKFDYLSCGIDKKPKWALVISSGGKNGVHSYYAIKEHAELVEMTIQYSSICPVSYTDRGEPTVSMPVFKGK